MFHKERVWQVKDLGSTAGMAYELQRCTWCCCSGFRAGGMLWLNDATGPDGAQEYAVVRESDGRQVESVTVSWCSPGNLQGYIDRFFAELDNMPGFSEWVLTPAAINHSHLPCVHCA